MSEKTVRTHKSVLTNEVLEYLNPQPGKTYLDVTFGIGGHTSAILDAEPTCSVIAMDWDTRALEEFGPALQEKYGDRLHLVWGNFALLYKIAAKEGIHGVDGILADFGTSQIQIFERPGFSFDTDTPLDMRMSPPHQKITAEEVVNKSSEQALEQMFWQFSDERHARPIARAIVEQRKIKRITTTKQLAAIIMKAIPHSPTRQRIHPATRVFQALRIYVNKELDNISAFLPAALKLLNPGGRLVCISFHSLEDRLVKDFFREQEQLLNLDVLTPKVVTATDEELEQNASSRSARLRAAQRKSE